MTYGISIRTRWGRRRRELSGQWVADAVPVLAVYLRKDWWFVIHAPSGYVYPISFKTDRFAQAWAKRFWSETSPTERLQLATSHEEASVVSASLSAWESLRQQRPDRHVELEAAG